MDILLGPTVRLGCVACSCIVLTQVLAMWTLGVGLATDFQRLNRILCVSSVCFLGWLGVSAGMSSPRLFVRGAALAVSPVMLLIALFLLFGVTLPESDVLASFKADGKHVVLYLTSLPLTSDSVLIETQYPLFPGVHAFKSIALIDPAWDPAVVRGRAGEVILAWKDEGGARKVKTFLP